MNPFIARLLMATDTFEAYGGTITYYGPYKVHTFLSSGTFVVDRGATRADILIVGGGGSGGCGHYTAGGGGGAGDVLEITGILLTKGSYSIVVGAGGAPVGRSRGNDGQPSSAFGIVALPGGGGGGEGNKNGRGSIQTYAAGGGAAGPGAGSSGGAGYKAFGASSNANIHGGGGGGNISNGAAPSSGAGGAGGAGFVNSFRTGSNVTYGIGGTGAHYYASGKASDMPANTGHGGTGQASSTGTSSRGGSGIVVIRYYNQ